MSTQLFAPHSVATSDTNSIDPRSWRALMSRGSSTSRKIVMSDSIGRSTKQVKLLKNLVFLSMQQKFTHMRFPCPQGGRELHRAPHLLQHPLPSSPAPLTGAGRGGGEPQTRSCRHIYAITLPRRGCTS